MMGGFYGIAKIMLKQASKDRDAERAERDADRQERKELSKAIKDMAGATGRVADATKLSASEAKDRNGHLAELVMKTQENNNLLAKNAVKELKSIIEIQTIKDQTVVHQHIKGKEVEK